MRESEADFEAAFQDAPAGLFAAALAMAGRPSVQVNAALLQLTGRSAPELLNARVADLAPHASGPAAGPGSY